jgi:type II secretory pathway component PulF
MTLDEGLSVLQKRLKQPRLQQMTHALHQALVDGRSFSQALRDFARVSADLRTSSRPAKRAARSRISNATRRAPDAGEEFAIACSRHYYPAFLALAGMGLITLITFMVLQLVGFMSERRRTSLPTQILLNESPHHGVLVARLGDCVESPSVSAPSSGPMRADRLGSLSPLIPGYGRVIRHRYYAQFSRTLGTLMENGALLRATDLVAEIAGNRYPVKMEFVDVIDGLRSRLPHEAELFLICSRT